MEEFCLKGSSHLLWIDVQLKPKCQLVAMSSRMTTNSSYDKIRWNQAPPSPYTHILLLWSTKLASLSSSSSSMWLALGSQLGNSTCSFMCVPWRWWSLVPSNFGLISKFKPELEYICSQWTWHDYKFTFRIELENQFKRSEDQPWDKASPS